MDTTQIGSDDKAMEILAFISDSNKEEVDYSDNLGNGRKVSR